MLIAGLATAALLALAASPASAVIFRLPNGRYLNYQGIEGKPTPTNVTRKAPTSPAARASNLEPAFSNLDYSGGPVMPSNTDYVIAWNPTGYGGSPYEGASGGLLGYISGVGQFFTDLAHDSGTTSNSDSVANQYNDASGNTAAYSVHYGGTLTDTDALPANGCSSGTYCITDAQIQGELNKFLTANGLPRGLTNEYFLLTPPQVASCFDAAGTQCSGNATTGQVFCAYHSQSATSTPFLYANIPYTSANATFTGGVDGCDPFDPNTPNNGECGTTYFLSGGCDYNFSWADGTLSAISHEHIESITDPQPNNAWTDYQTCAKGAPVTCGGEIGDKCNGDQGNDPATTYVAGPTTVEPRNMTINGRPYWLQREWSNQSHGCLNHLSTLEAAPGASFTVTGDNSTPLLDHLDAGGSGAGVAEYVWQFNDDVKPGDTPQQATVETTSPTITHTFPQAGTYTVALTTMTADGRSKGTVTQTVSAGLTQAAFAVSTGSPVDTSPVSFDASSTTHDSAVGISSYSWSFGDGSTGSGVTASHTFSPGAHTVALTVTDTLGRTSSTSHSLTVADQAPTAAFGAPSGRARIPVGFSGTGTDDEGISSYSWSFGDGGSATGASVSHAYARAGTYTVTLTVADADGASGSVSHVVTMGAPRCAVPKLQGQSLQAARGALSAYQCKLGKVTKPKHAPRGKPGRHKHWALVVIRTSPPAGAVKPVGTKVNVVLAYKAMTVRHSARHARG